MAFSLTFIRLSRDGVEDADRAGLEMLLQQRELEVAPSSDDTHHLVGVAGPLSFDGHWSDLHLDPLDKEGVVSGGIWHATLSKEECAFIYDLCVAGRMIIMNPQGDPLFIVPEQNHLPTDLPEGVDLADIAWITNPTELAQVLSGGFAAFAELKNRVMDGTGDA
ncbi:MAG: hypothetical protein ABJB03_01985 [Rhodoglobus sp.]